MKRLQSNRYLLLFFFVLVLGVVLRFYRLPETMQFLGDQGRDALIARAIFMERDPAFIGPVTSVGNMYLGPLYYYFMVVPLMMSYPSPVGPAYAVALVGVLTLALVYIVGKDIVGKKTAMLAMCLYAIAPVIITNVRFSWNPNIVPLFSLLIVWGLHKVIHKDDRFWLLIGICATALFQLHYITLILIGCCGLIWLWQLAIQWKSKTFRTEFFTMTGVSILIFILSLSPLFIFDLKHDFLNFRAFGSFFTGTGEASHFKKGIELSGVFYSFIALSVRNITETFGIIIPSSLALVSLAVMIYVVIKTYVFMHTMDKYKRGKRLLLFLFLVSMAVLSFYKGSIFDHYLGFVFPIAILVFATVLVRFWDFLFLRPLVLLVFLGCVVGSIQYYPGKQNLTTNMFLFESVAQEIRARVGKDQSFDILLLSENNDFLGMNYRYFLTTTGNAPAREEDVGNFSKLFVIDERHQKNPLDTPQYKMAVWPNRQIIDDFLIPNGPHVVSLIR